MGDVYKGDFSNEIVGAVCGDLITVQLISGKVEKVLLEKIKRHGVEGYEVDLNNRPLTFYPFSSIIKIKKYSELK